MAVKQKETTFVGVRLGPKAMSRMKAVSNYLTGLADGSRVSCADVVRWLLELPDVAKIVEGKK